MNQKSREAIIELLFLSLYLDQHLSLAEDAVFGQALDSLGWEGDVPREKFIFTAFSTARGASQDEAKGVEFFLSRAAVIKNDGGEAEALTWLTKVLGADGLTPLEKNFLSHLESRLYP